MVEGRMVMTIIHPKQCNMQKGNWKNGKRKHLEKFICTAIDGDGAATRGIDAPNWLTFCITYVMYVMYVMYVIYILICTPYDKRWHLRLYDCISDDYYFLPILYPIIVLTCSSYCMASADGLSDI